MRLITNMFIIMAFDSNHEFADEHYEIEYDNHKLELKAQHSLVHNLVTECLTRRKDQKDAYTAMFSFLGELSWLYKMKINLLGLSANIHAPNKTGYWIDKTLYKRENKTILIDFQITKSDIQKLALGIYREGISANSVFYSYFCYCRTIMILNTHRKDFANWVNNNLVHLKQGDGKYIADDLSKNQNIDDIGLYLYEKGRCALAHADVNVNNPDKPILKPFDYEDMVRVMKELALVKELAEIFIHKDLKVLTWKEAVEEWKKRSRKGK